MRSYFVLFLMLLVSNVHQIQGQSSVSVTDCGSAGMGITVVVDERFHPAGKSALYFSDCNAFTSEEQADGTMLVTIGVDTMKSGGCGKYMTSANGDATFTTSIIIPVVSFLNTRDDLKVDVKCTFATTFVAELTPDVATKINTLPPSDEDEASTKPPELMADIRNPGLALLTTITVGQPMLVYVYFIDDQNGYWDSMITDSLVAFDNDHMTGIRIQLVEERCPGVFKSALGIIYNEPAESDTSKIQFNAFRFKDTAAAEVFFVVTVTVCATTAPPLTCAHDCDARKRRETSHFMHQFLRQSHKDRRSIEQTGMVTDSPNSPTTYTKFIKLRMTIHNEGFQLEPTLYPMIPGLVEIGDSKVCIPRPVSIAVLVIILVLGAVVITMAMLFVVMMRRRSKKQKKLNSVSEGVASTASKPVSADLQWQEESIHKVALLDNEQLAAYSLRAKELPGTSTRPALPYTFQPQQ